MSLWDYLGRRGGAAPEPPAASSDVESIRRIIRSLDRLEPARARNIAAFAFVLARVARADLVITDEETAEMERLVREQTGLPEEQAVLVVEIARHQNMLFGGTDNFLVTRELKATATPEEKLALLRCLFAVSAADASITTDEEGTITQIAAELGVEREEMTRVRAEFRDKRAVFRRPADPRT